MCETIGDPTKMMDEKPDINNKITDILSTPKMV